MMLSAPLLLLLTTLFLILTLFFFILRSNYLIVTVKQKSMYPALIPGDRILALRHWSPDQLCRGQVVVLKIDHLDPSIVGPHRSPSTLYIKRIVGVAGETFLTTQEGEELIHNPYYVPEDPKQHLWHIPASSILVRGDNRSYSLDSHMWGPVPVKCVQAVMLVHLKRRSIDRDEDPSIQGSLQSLTIEENAPAFNASTLHGKIVNLQTYKDHHLLLVFFQPVPILTEQFFRQRWSVVETIKGETQIVLVSGSSADKTLSFLKKVRVDLPVIIAPRSKNTMFQRYKVHNFPHFCYIDENGKVLSTGPIPVNV